jgi:predicted PurR-regulated permease PerM
MKRSQKPAVLLLTIFIVLVVICICGLGSSLIPIFIAFVFAGLLRPVILRLEQFGLSRRLAIALISILLLLIFVGLGVSVVPPLLSELSGLIQVLPEKVHLVLQRLQAFATRFDVQLPVNPEDVKSLLQNALTHSTSDLFHLAQPLMERTFSNLLQVVLVFLDMALIPLFFVYFSYSFEDIGAAVFVLVPPRHRSRAQQLGHRVRKIFRGYVYGELLVAITLAAYYVTCLTFLKLRFSIVVGILTGLLVVIPYVGFAIGFSTAVLLDLTDFKSWSHLVMLIAVFAVGQSLEAMVITPRWVGHQVGLHPLTAIVALLIGGNLFGFLGLVLAVPTAAALQELLRPFLNEYRRSSFYLD